MKQGFRALSESPEPGSGIPQLFALARAQAPCVIFIDEIDGLGRRATGDSAA